MLLPRRVVVTGLGVVAPNGVGIEEFANALKNGRSGIRFIPEMKDLNFACHVGGVPQNISELAKSEFRADELVAMNSSLLYSALSAKQCYVDAGLTVPQDTDQNIDWDTGVVMGSCLTGMETLATRTVPMIAKGQVKRLGSMTVEQTMASGVSAHLGRIFALGGAVTTNSSACTTGTEAIAEGFFKIRFGRLKRVIAGGVEGESVYSWAGFDSMRVLNRTSNHAPEKASRPMSAGAAGFVPGCGAGTLMLEDYEEAIKRGARIYAEIIGAHINCGGHRDGGSMTMPGKAGVVRCIREALTMAQVKASEIGLINGHLTATAADPIEIKNWASALGVEAKLFPTIQSTKSMIGHTLSAAGAIEAVATVLQLNQNFIHPSINAEDVHLELLDYANSIPQTKIDTHFKIAVKSSFGFGDVNGCLVFRSGQSI